MSFILKTNPIPVNIKLTAAGREKLSNGNFNVTHFSLGDSEMNYKFYKDNEINSNTSNVLLPIENNKEIRYKIKRSFNDTNYLYRVNISSTKNEVYNEVNTGFFNGNDIYNMSINTDLNKVKESNLKLDISQLSIDTNVVDIIKDNGYTTGNGVEIGDYLFVSWENQYVSGKTKNDIQSEIYTPYLFYKIVSISGSIAGNNLELTLDRDLPNFGTGLTSSTYYSNCFIYPKYDSIINYYGSEYLSDYWDFTDQNYIENCYNIDVNERINIWNYTLFYPENYIGITETDKLPNDLYSYKYKSFLEYISANSVDLIYGIVHYTNSLPDNNIGEGFYENSAELWLPTIMWNKNKTNKIGVKFICQQNINIIQESGVRYYNLIDENQYVVGKCFPDLKIFLIEDQELVKVLSFKSNRNWTLPTPKIGISGLNC
jgi:hypothetical protein